MINHLYLNGYYVHTPPSEYGFSPSPNRLPQDGAEPLLSTQPEINKLLQLSEWEANRLDDELSTIFIRYTIEWKVKVNNRSVSEDTEQDVALTLSAYWPLVLREKLYKVIEEKVARKRRRFNGLTIDWTTVEKQLLAWGKFYAGGKELRLVIIFNYIEDDYSIRVAIGSNEKRGRSSVTKRMLNERDQ
ncbi:unnamed protein product [Penicillium salamii]|nr:unnamed protein product [Penicillium salamii]